MAKFILSLFLFFFKPPVKMILFIIGILKKLILLIVFDNYYKFKMFYLNGYV